MTFEVVASQLAHA